MILLENFLQYILEFLYSITASWGFAIVLLSVSVNMLLLPVYMLAEHLQGKERAMQSKMQGKLKEIQEAFQGPERFMMMRSLYRIHQYHPVMGLRSLASLLIQIPFFFAAYNMLKHYDALSGLSFAFIPDLHMADALIPFGRFTINLLPFIMTAVNIYAAQIYARRKDPESLLSTWAMALLFLVLLYTAPAALVLYWTCNNIFSLIKNATLSHKENNIVQRSSMAIIREKIATWLARDKTVIRVVAVCWGVAAYWVIAYLHTITYAQYLSHTLINMAGALFVFPILILATKYCFECKKKQFEKNVLLLIAIGIELFAVALLAYYIFIPLHQISIRTDYVKLLALLLMGMPNIIFLPFFIRMIRRASQGSIPTKKIHDYTVFVAVCACAILIFFALPAELFMNSPEEVDVSFYRLVLHNMPLVLLSMLAAMAIYYITPRMIRLYTGYALVTVSISFLVYALLVPFDLGRMNGFQLILPQRIDPTMTMYVFEAMGIVLLVYFVYTFFKRRPAYLVAVELIFAVVLLVQLANPELWKQSTIAAANNTGASIDSSGKVPSSAVSVLSFSKTEQNIVVIFLDMANGGYIQQIEEEDATFFDEYDGFTWYPNILSISVYTSPSMPPMLGGWHYAPENIAKIKGANLGEKVMASYNTFFETFQRYNYEVAISGLGYYMAQKAVCEVLPYDVACLDDTEKEYISYWLANNQQAPVAPQTDTEIIQIVNRVGLMRSVPIAYKRLVYNKGTWNLKIARFKNSINYERVLKAWSFIDSLSSLSTITAEKATVKYFINEVTHVPYAMDSECTLRMDVFPDEPVPTDYTGSPSDYGRAALYTQRCTLESLKKWFRWLKDNDIYDNTKIIIVSDHGNSLTDDPMNIHNISPMLMGRSSTVMFNRSHPLLMVKDFNTRGSMKSDNRFLSNADTAAILFHSIDGYSPPADAHPNDRYDPTKKLITNRELYIVDTLFYDWVDMVKEKNTFEITQKYTVKNNIFLPENWE